MESKAVILFAESISVLVEAMGMKSYNDERIRDGYSVGYPDSHFAAMADDLREKIEEVKNLIQV